MKHETGTRGLPCAKELLHLVHLTLICPVQEPRILHGGPCLMIMPVYSTQEIY